jgi:hypothetical protein
MDSSTDIFLLFACSAAEPNNGQEVSELRSQVSGLNDRIAAMHEQIDRLAGLVSNLQLAPPAAASSSSGDALKKRKIGERGNSVPLLRRQSSTDSTLMLGDYRASGAELQSGPQLIPVDGDFFGDDMELLFSETADLLMDDEPALAAAAAPVVPPAHIVPVLSPAPAMASVDSSAVDTPAAVAIGAVNAAANDISSVLDRLSPELRLRFVDRLAEVMGAQLTQSIAQQVQVQVHVSQQSQSDKTQLVQPQLHVPYVPTANAPAFAAPVSTAAPTASSTDPAHFRLPSGSKAPEIAIPLASAAIAALLSSMQTFSHNPQLLNQPAAIKDEVSCK